MIKIVLKRINDKTKKIYEKIVEFEENIEKIYLTDENLVEIPYGLEQFKFLTTLNLDQNQISKIENLDKNINLNVLYLNNNKITKIENLDNNINLQRLYLYDNQITKIENIHHLEKLKYFRLFDEEQNENIKESLSISLDNYNLELKEIQIQQELLKLELLKQKEKEYFDNNFEQIKQQFIQSNISNNNDLLI